MTEKQKSSSPAGRSLTHIVGALRGALATGDENGVRTDVWLPAATPQNIAVVLDRLAQFELGLPPDYEQAKNDAVGAFIGRASHEVEVGFLGPAFPEQPDAWRGKTFCRIRWFEHPSDPGVCGWQLAEDQAGTVVADLAHSKWNEPAERALFEREMQLRDRSCRKDEKGDYEDDAIYRAWCIWEIARRMPPAGQTAKVPAALAEAVKALYFADDSDFGTALWGVVRALGGPEVVELLEKDAGAAYVRYAKGGNHG